MNVFHKKSTSVGKLNVESIGMSHYGNQAGMRDPLHFTLLPEKQAHSSPIMGVNIIKTDTHHQGNSRSKYVN